MNKLFSSLLILLQIASPTLGFADAVIFSGSDVKALKSNLDLNGQSKILSGTTDPSSSATSANPGSLYLNSSTGDVFRKTDSGSSTNWTRFSAPLDQSYEITNLTVTATASAVSHTLTVAFKTKAGSDPSSSDPIRIGFRSATATSGAYNERSATSAITSLVVTSGSTLGTASATTHFLYVYAIDATALGGGIEPAISSIAYDNGTILSTTSEGGAGAADSNRVVYSTTARANVPVRLVARIKSNQTTAGTWDTAPTEVSIWPFDIEPISASCYQNATQTTISNDTVTTIKCDTKAWDSANAYSTSTGAFTAPKTTRYHISAGYILNTASSAFNGTTEEMQIIITVNSVIKRRLKMIPYASQAYPSLTIGVDLDANAGETIELQAYENSGAASYDTVTTGPYTWFSIHEIR